MSKCMTIADETVDQKDISLDIAPKEIVEIILEEALLSALIVSDKGCSRIGDSNITDEFRQPYDQLSNQKDFEQVEPSQAQPGANKDPNLNSRENLDRAAPPARGNLEQIIDSFVKEEEKTKSLNDCQIISEETLADNELQIKNGQIHLEKNKVYSDTTRQEYLFKKDVIKDEKIEIEYFDKGQLNKIYVPLNVTNSTNIESDCESKQKDAEKEEEGLGLNEEEKKEEDTERPFKPFTTEDLRQSTLQVWENGNSSLVGRWDGDIVSQRDKVVKIMEELSSVQVFPDSFADPNRPRALALAEEDVKKMTKEIQEMNFTQSRINSEDSVSCPDGEREADLGSDSMGNLQMEHFNSQNIIKNSPESDQHQLEKEIISQTYQTSPNIITFDKEENYLNNSQSEIETSVEEKKSQNLDLTFSTELQPECMSRKSSELIQKDSVNLKDSFNEFKIDELTMKEPDLTPDLDEESAITESPQTQQGTLSWSGLKWGSKEAVCTLSSNSFLEEKHWERISVDYSPLTEEAEDKIESNRADNLFQGIQSRLEGRKSGIIQNGEDANLNAEIVNEKLEETLICAEKNVENYETLVERVYEDETGTIKAETEEENLIKGEKGGSFDFTETAISLQKSEKTFNCDDEFNRTESDQEPSVSPQTSQIQDNEQSTPESEVSETLVSGSQKFKLHSQKMFLSPHLEPVGQVPNDFNLTESEEAFIDMSENVIQIIDPPENSADEDSNSISFSLLAETTNLRSISRNVDSKSELCQKTKDFGESENPPKKVYSGMTTIGPIKNMDYDPKDLSAPDIDYGKMTRITSSRQLARDMGLLNSENPALSVKIIEEDDSDEDLSLNLEDEHIDRNSLVNRDIASLTKVQKVREVMSHQAKPEEDFEDEESLPRPRLDLKDVESMTDERYKFPDVSIPLLSFEIGDRNLEAEKELIESMGLVISGLTNACFYEEELEDNNEIQTNNATYENDNIAVDYPKTLAPGKKNSKAKSSNAEEISLTKSEEKTAADSDEENEKEVLDRKYSQHGNSDHAKSSTLGNVFRKASSKFLRKDSDLCMRNSKSLPRDTGKISTTNSIRSILDDCQSSASNMLKKSCSLLKNTESIFKSISQSMVTSERGSGSNTTQKKLSPSESDVSTIEKKFSGFFKKEDFTKAKNLIKSKVEKTFKSSERENSSPGEPEISTEKEELRLVVRNEDNMRIDRIENFKKFLPKSPLVYKSQFVRSQMNFQSPSETETPVNPVTPSVIEKQPDETASGGPVEDGSNSVPEKEKEFTGETQPIRIYSQETLQWIIQKQELQLPVKETLEPQQPEYIVMETIQGLPASDLESPSSEKENLNVENTTVKAGNDMKKIEASNSLQILNVSSHDVAPHFPGTDEEKTPTKTPSERKIKTKKKKFTARFRSFWCSAFGRAKTPEKKGDLS